MRIGEIAEITGISVSNVRFYEKKGLLTPARESENKFKLSDFISLKKYR